ncbi:MAG TPA: LD-carboxypeptidase [Puia sp.]|nr:LD-carboxypeptidase [Puia sp.]
MSLLPPYLRPGDTIAIVCPAGYMPMEKAQTCNVTLRQWGYRVRIGSTLGGDSNNYFSGSDEERLADLQQMLDDPDVGAILCGRGGYGLTRIIDRIDFTRFRANPKWVIGYSDVTLLHAHIEANFGIATLHAPMAAAFNDGGAEGPDVQSLRMALEGKDLSYFCDPHPFNRVGPVSAPVAGGNLAMLAHLTGTASAAPMAGKILFIEDVGEYLYNIDRMFRQLQRSGCLDGLVGLIVGNFTDSKDTVRPFGATAEEIIRDVTRDYDYPVCFGFPVGHGVRNVALRVGVPHRLSITEESVSLYCPGGGTTS